MKKMFLLVSIMGLLFIYSQNIQVHAKNYNDNTDWVQNHLAMLTVIDGYMDSSFSNLKNLY